MCHMGPLCKGPALSLEWALKHRYPSRGARGRAKSVLRTLALDRWTSRCAPAAQIPLTLTWRQPRWRPSGVDGLPACVVEELGVPIVEHMG